MEEKLFYVDRPLLRMEINGKEFREITTFATCSEIRRASYLISRDGEVYSLISNRILKPTVDSNGYLIVNLQLNNGKSKVFYIHRMVMIVYDFIMNYDEMQVNHCDGIKTHSYQSNLEWTTPLGNVLHAKNTNLLCTGEDCSWAVLTEQQVREICERIQNGSYITISELAEEYNCSVTTIGDIARGKHWQEISKDYDLNYDARARFTDEQVHFICQAFSQNKDKSFSYLYYLIIFFMGLPDESFIRRRIYKIYRKDPANYAYITSLYDY